ncbi:TetR family transcriptional regulator [Pseudomonas aeruginosa]|nr:hypothetical protein Q038_01576 [Pseudomonas aeruginosa BWHPSA025]OPE00205.1 TetR family transcriptional regulator [Pseudomonas aeruginosa]OWJ50931.1 TetR family transcriptional regulator [Pseudomonas aeruginosa]PBM85995.1 TetR family transcriptional regulator [Pseudomonas aeruginosa]
MMTAPREMGGVRGRWVKVRQARRLHLIEATAEVFAEHGYENSSMGMLASAADVTKATLYAHFKEKSRLFEAVLGHWLDSLPDPMLLPVEGTGLGEQLVTVERDLRHPASRAMTRALVRSVYVPETCLERWHYRHGLLLRHLEEVLSKRTGHENARHDACRFLNLALCNIDRRDAMKLGNLPTDWGVADLFARAYRTDGRASGCIARNH